MDMRGSSCKHSNKESNSQEDLGNPELHDPTDT